MAEVPEIKLLGEKAFLVEFRSSVDEKLLEKILSLKKYISQELVKEKVEVINTYSSLLIAYPSTINNVYGELLKLKQLVGETNIQNKILKRIFHVPVCYAEEFSLDMDELANLKKLSKGEIIRCHTAPLYTVYFIGFLPGFLYLGGLDKRLHISRKVQPRLKVEKGAVGIGGNQTGIYPTSSPGGWQIIGNSPVPLFDKNQDPPCTISAGDKIKFYSVSYEEHAQMSREVEAGTFSFKMEVHDS